MELILWSFLIVVLVLMTVLLCGMTVFLMRLLKAESKDIPKLDIPSPVQAVKEYKAHKEAKREQNRYETILANISNYDGTSNNQMDVPRG
jgi:hypothetical protein